MTEVICGVPRCGQPGRMYQDVNNVDFSVLCKYHCDTKWYLADKQLEITTAMTIQKLHNRIARLRSSAPCK